MAKAPKPPYKASTNEVWVNGQWIPKEDYEQSKLGWKSMQAIDSVLGKKLTTSSFIQILLDYQNQSAAIAAEKAMKSLEPTCFMTIEL